VTPWICFVRLVTCIRSVSLTASSPPREMNVRPTGSRKYVLSIFVVNCDGAGTFG
jgi:hypothetical protein